MRALSRTNNPPTVVVGYAFNDHSTLALDQALRLAGAWPRSRLIILSAGSVEVERKPSDTDATAARRVLEKLGAVVRARINALMRSTAAFSEPELTLRVTDAAAAEALRSVAFLEGADMIVVGTGEKTAIQDLLLGSVSRDLMGNAPCSVLVCRERADADVPSIEPPHREGQEPTLGRRHTYHYESRVGQSGVTMPLLVPMN